MNIDARDETIIVPFELVAAVLELLAHYRRRLRGELTAARLRGQSERLRAVLAEMESVDQVYERLGRALSEGREP